MLEKILKAIREKNAEQLRGGNNDLTADQKQSQ